MVWIDFGAIEDMGMRYHFSHIVALWSLGWTNSRSSYLPRSRSTDVVRPEVSMKKYPSDFQRRRPLEEAARCALIFTIASSNKVILFNALAFHRPQTPAPQPSPQDSERWSDPTRL